MNGAYEFQYPAVLLLLALLPIYALLLGRMGRVAALRFPSTEIAKLSGAKARSAAGRFLFALRLFALALLIVAVADPVRVSTAIERKSEGIDIMLALDMSGSMQAPDMDIGGTATSRIEAAKAVIAEFVDKRLTDRIGLIAFAGNPYLASPLTLNHAWLKKIITKIQATGAASQGGTAIGDATAMAADRMKNRTGKGSRILILLTDGDDNASKRIKPVPAAELALGLGQRVYTIGVGKGGNEEFPLLGKMASLSGGKFYRATNGSELKKIYEDIGRLETSEVRVITHTQYTHLFVPVALAALALLLAETVLRNTRNLRLP
jgi:Ca-activated chloride channel family protein